MKRRLLALLMCVTMLAMSSVVIPVNAYADENNAEREQVTRGIISSSTRYFTSTTTARVYINSSYSMVYFKMNISKKTGTYTFWYDFIVPGTSTPLFSGYVGDSGEDFTISIMTNPPVGYYDVNLTLLYPSAPSTPFTLNYWVEN